MAEIAPHGRIGTWDLISLRHHGHPITCEWVYKVKTYGSLKRYRAHHVAHGFQQEYGHIPFTF